MKHVGLLLASVLLVPYLAAQTNCEEGSGPLTSGTPAAIAPAEIIQKFAANEARFKQAQINYVFTQDLTVQTLGSTSGFGRGGTPPVTGEYRLVADVTFDRQGRRLEHVTYAPSSSLRAAILTREDFDDIRTLSGFTLTPDDLAQYDIHYKGQQRVDQLDTYAFEVAPKHAKKDVRLFEGHIWVDSRDFAIVKTCGKRVPDRHDKNQENVSPKYVVYREQFDGQYWFPTYARADDILHFTRSTAHIKETVKYQYKPRAGG
jgi:hypothetical protein